MEDHSLSYDMQLFFYPGITYETLFKTQQRPHLHLVLEHTPNACLKCSHSRQTPQKDHKPAIGQLITFIPTEDLFSFFF